MGHVFNQIRQQGRLKIQHLAKSTRILGPAVFPSNRNELLLQNGLASVQFLKSLGQDKIGAKDIGIHGDGRLFRRIVQEPDDTSACQNWVEEYTEQVEKYNKKHKTDDARAATIAALDAYAEESRENPQLYGDSYVDARTIAIQSMSEVHFDDTSIIAIVGNCKPCIQYFEDEIRGYHEMIQKSKL